MENYIGFVWYYANFNLNSRVRKRRVLIAVLWLISQTQIERFKVQSHARARLTK